MNGVRQGWRPDGGRGVRKRDRPGRCNGKRHVGGQGGIPGLRLGGGRLEKQGSRLGALPFASIFSFILFIATACATGAKSGPSLTPPPSENTDRRVAIGALLEDPSAYMTGGLVIEGVFKGWKGKCDASAITTRSDWVLEDATGCIYVTGKIPDQVSPSDPKDEALTVRGYLEIHPNGKPCFVAANVELRTQHE